MKSIMRRDVVLDGGRIMMETRLKYDRRGRLCNKGDDGADC